MEKKLNVLVVDDDVFYLKSVILGLNAEYSSSVVFKYFFNANELLRRLAAEGQEVDYVLLDYNLDVSDRFTGVELIREIKKINSKIQIIIVSAQNNNQVMLSTIKAGASSYIQKGSDILDSIRNVLNKAIRINEEKDKGKGRFAYVALFCFVTVTTLLLIYFLSLGT